MTYMHKWNRCLRRQRRRRTPKSIANAPPPTDPFQLERLLLSGERRQIHPSACMTPGRIIATLIARRINDRQWEKERSVLHPQRRIYLRSERSNAMQASESRGMMEALLLRRARVLLRIRGARVCVCRSLRRLLAQKRRESNRRISSDVHTHACSPCLAAFV
jgi:hypothetical protein